MFKRPLDFMQPFLNRDIKQEFPSWEDDTCRRIEDALMNGLPVAVVGFTEKKTELLNIMARWLEEAQDKLVYWVSPLSATVSDFMSGILTSIYAQLEGEDAPIGEDVSSGKVKSYDFHTRNEFIEFVQQLLEEHERTLFVFIGDLERWFISMKEVEAYAISELIVECAKRSDVPIHFTYAFEKIPQFWIKNEETTPFKISHVVRMASRGEERKERVGFSSHGLRRLP